jgi:hypothetical protein
MLEYVIYRWRLRKLQKARRGVIEKSPRPVEGQEFEADYSTEMERIVAEHRIYRLISDYYYELAFQFGVPTPSGKDYWEESEAFPGTQHLSRAGLFLLRAAIHEEKKRRLEHFSVWVAGVTGLVGALTGLVAVMGAGG